MNQWGGILEITSERRRAKENGKRGAAASTELFYPHLGYILVHAGHGSCRK